MNCTGLIVPFNLSTAILRVLTDLYPEDLHEFVKLIPLMCVSLQHFYGTWISFWYYMSVSAIVFRSSIKRRDYSVNLVGSLQVCDGEVLSPGPRQ